MLNKTDVKQNFIQEFFWDNDFGSASEMYAAITG